MPTESASSSVVSSVNVSAGAKPLPTDFTYNNQQTGLVKYLSLNGSELTVGSAKHSGSEQLNVSDIETAGGRIKRYHKKNKRSLSVSYEYIPSNSNKTVDGRKGRDFIYNLAVNAPQVTISYKDEPTGSAVSYTGFIDSYSESIIRRDPVGRCVYYQINFELVEA